MAASSRRPPRADPSVTASGAARRRPPACRCARRTTRVASRHPARPRSTRRSWWVSSRASCAAFLLFRLAVSAEWPLFGHHRRPRHDGGRWPPARGERDQHGRPGGTATCRITRDGHATGRTTSRSARTDSRRVPVRRSRAPSRRHRGRSSSTPRGCRSSAPDAAADRRPRAGSPVPARGCAPSVLTARPSGPPGPRFGGPLEDARGMLRRVPCFCECALLTWRRYPAYRA